MKDAPENHAEDEAPEAPSGIVCTRCATLNDPAATLCSRCGAPLGDFASSSPWDYSHAGGPAYPEPVSPRKKPIILIGVWLYFGPSAIAGLVFLVNFAEDIIHEEASSGIIALAALMAAYILVCVWVLFTVTRRFFRNDDD